MLSIGSSSGSIRDKNTARDLSIDVIRDFVVEPAGASQ